MSGAAYTFDIYEARDGWRWRMIAGNGKIVADGAEAYSTRGNARRAVNSILASSWVVGGFEPGRFGTGS
jgi:uncharacterized protein YegP (UPF0339 family)